MSVSPKHRRWLVPAVIAAIGWVVAIPIIVFAAPEEADPLGEYRSSKQYEASMERIGGKSAVMGSQLNEFLASLFQGQKLGFTIGVTSLVVALIADRWQEAGRRQQEPEG